MRSNSGFSLIEVMIVMAILMIAAFGFSQFMANTSKQQTHAEVRNSMIVLNAQVHTNAMDANAIFSTMNSQIEVPKP
jgi:prepilin-type N-terminal cleavage/methylation domain-containing protein